MKKVAASCIALAIGAFCSLSAQADTVDFSGFAHGSETVTATLSLPNGPLSQTVAAGGFATVLDGGPSFESYCIDLYQHITFGQSYADYAAPVGLHAFVNGNAYADLGRLFGTAGRPDTAVEEAAFQIAVWEIAYETTGTPYSLSSGAATFAGGTADASGALSLASGWLAGLGNGTPLSIGVLESPTRQDVIFAPVPEPSTYALMTMGLLAMGYAARRRARG